MAKRKTKVYNSLLANLISILGYCVAGIGVFILFSVNEIAGIVVLLLGLGLIKLADIVA
ncbi:MAG: hypothetical protein IKU34_09765 [Clostridia bacterium]|nr:hypothetical protein [Clostridia bacterium]